MNVFVDMDGILSDFVTGACKAHGVANPYEVMPASSAGETNLHLLLGMTKTEFWKPLESHDFWANLPLMKDIGKTIEFINLLENPPYLLTAPTLSSGCFSGKYEWVKKFFPHLSRNLIITSHKDLMAGERRLLIDDLSKNTDAWLNHGGRIILIPRPWNSRHAEQASFNLMTEFMLEVS